MVENLQNSIKVIFIHAMGRESLIETTRVRMYTSFILAVIAAQWIFQFGGYGFQGMDF